MEDTNNPVGEQKPPRSFGEAGDILIGWCRNNLTEARIIAGGLKKEKHLKLPDILERYNGLQQCLDDNANRCSLMQSVHPDGGVRRAAEVGEQETIALATEFSLDRGLYELFAAYETMEDDLDDPASRLFKKTLRDFHRSGVDRDEETRNKIRDLIVKMTEISQTFERNIREDTRFVEVTDPARLKGLPDDFLASHPADERGVVKISTDWVDQITVLTYAADASLREELWKVRMKLGHPKNEPVLKELLSLRYQLARILGYASWVDYATEELMIRTSRRVKDFIEEVAALGRPRSRRDMGVLLERKKQDFPDAMEVNPWEREYYVRLVKAEKFNFSPAEVRPYFDVRKVRQGIFDICSNLYGVSFVPNDQAERWHPAVQVFDVTENGAPIGRIYLDLHPRENKYKHAAMFNISAGSGRLPEMAIVTNFAEPDKTGGPALMEHRDVTTFFHEFGHLMHHVFAGRQKWMRQTSVAEWDFVEVPSQLFEEWAWDPGMLRLFAVNEKGEAIPEALVQRMRAADEFGKGQAVMQQMFYAALSLGLYNQDPGALDVRRTVDATQRAYSPFPVIPDSYLESSFGHLTGYSSNYYTYMWSLVIVKDLIAAFKSRGLADASISRQYRQTILEPGGSLDGAELVKNFLGREFNFDAYRRWLEG